MLIETAFRYNSAVFQSLSSSEYTVAVVKDSFLNGTSWSLAASEGRRKGSPGWDLQDGRLNPSSFDYNEIIRGMQAAAMEDLGIERHFTSIVTKTIKIGGRFPPRR